MRYESWSVTYDTWYGSEMHTTWHSPPKPSLYHCADSHHFIYHIMFIQYKLYKYLTQLNIFLTKTFSLCIKGWKMLDDECIVAKWPTVDCHMTKNSDTLPVRISKSPKACNICTIFGMGGWVESWLSKLYCSQVNRSIFKKFTKKYKINLLLKFCKSWLLATNKR